MKIKLIIPALLIGLLAVSCSAQKKAASAGKSIRVLIVGGGSSHDFDKWYKGVDAETLRKDGATVIYTSNTDSIAYYLPQTDVLYLSNNQPIKNEADRKAIFAFADAGKGLILGHPALWYNWKDWPEYNAVLAGGGATSHDKYGAFEETVVNTTHPITKDLEPKITLQDERYRYEHAPTATDIDVLVTNSVAGSDKVYPSIFIVKHPKARIVGIALGHDGGSHDIVFYQTILRNSVKWAAGK
ncbi:ThuA domain-containing protein [Mucilaginibacter sp. JRF]|uniref:ThuA domain-containing protein n=1 Tax=Mucilaginibacter sp. JRF TaxID=2780088 RepID=UPI0018804EB3|nr:ThuA domain-containing protein [Mucilaginibacter sp. JRF]MBE9586215.1 ThuA domain-containing protein [Mucilaginibacter sp. JRF]